MGGIGKTQLALEYAHRYKSDYRIIWWVWSEVPASASTDFRLLARELGLEAGLNTPPEEIVYWVHRKLEQQSGWLLIFDNAMDEQALAAFRPRGSAGHILITSRSKELHTVGDTLKVEVLPREEAVAFLVSS